MKRPFISLSDALRAADALDPCDAEAREAILKLLGLKIEVISPVTRSIGAWKPSSSQSIAAARYSQSIKRSPVHAPVRKPERRQAPANRSAIQSTVRKIHESKGEVDPPVWFGESNEVLGPAQPTGKPPPISQLFGRHWRRGILSAALATFVPEGDLDLDRIIEIIGGGRLLDRLPRLPAPTLRRGVLVLVDLGPGMEPFQEDQQQLVQALDDILADDRLEVLYFAGCPDRGDKAVGSGPRQDWIRWKAPPRGTPILVLSDFGIGGPVLDDDRATPAEWLRFAHQLRKESHLLLGLVPYEATRWPVKLTSAMTLIHWSERTTVGAVRRAMRDTML